MDEACSTNWETRKKFCWENWRTRILGISMCRRLDNIKVNITDIRGEYSLGSGYTLRIKWRSFVNTVPKFRFPQGPRISRQAEKLWTFPGRSCTVKLLKLNFHCCWTSFIHRTACGSEPGQETQIICRFSRRTMTTTMVIMKITAFWDETPCNLENHQRFGGTRCFHLKMDIARSSETCGMI